MCISCFFVLQKVMCEFDDWSVLTKHYFDFEQLLSFFLLGLVPDHFKGIRSLRCLFLSVFAVLFPADV